MAKRVEVVSEALRADPPGVRGLVIDGVVHRLEKVKGKGATRRFKFDLHHKWFQYVELIRLQGDVALVTPEDAGRLQVTFKAKFPVCPGCGSVLPAREFWDHYNDLHAVRQWWLNQKHWEAFLRGAYRKPPEFE